MNKILSFLIVLAIFNTSCKKSDNEPTQQQIISDSLSVVRTQIGKTTGKEVPSLSVYIQTPNETLFVSSSREGETPITPETYFRFASNSKNFTSTAVLNMYEDGWLDIYSSITDTIPGTDVTYVPSTSEWDIPYKNEITIERLLQHGAGVYDIDNDSVPGYNGKSFTEYTMANNPDHQFNADELVNQLGKHNLYYWAPGTDYHYSNTGYTILSEIIARVYSVKSASEKTFKDYMFDYIYGPESMVPLNINFPDLASEKDLPNPHAIGNTFYTDSEGGDIQYDASNMSAHVAEGNGYGTFVELNKYVRSLMTGNNVLNMETITLMQNDYGPGSTTYSLGCTTLRNLGYGHNGEIRGYLSIMAYDPEHDVSMVVMMNAVNYTNYDNYIENFKGMYYGAWKVRELLGYPGNPEQ